MANVKGGSNGRHVHHLGMVVQVLHDDKVTIHAINSKDPTSCDIPMFPTGTLFHDCQDAVKRKRGKEWVPGKFEDGVPLTGTTVHLTFSSQKTENGTEWKVDWFRWDKPTDSDGNMQHQ